MVAAQLSWLSATRVLPVQTVANSQLLNPAFTILFAYLLLGELPTALEWTVMAIIAVGMLLPRLPIWGRSRRTASHSMLAAGLVGTH